ncbi:MAG: SsgA family sporulation/cell division regulator [Actinobacteria bacterium]|nr:SsgA family sporulation/cell division regulator [Actinomycetota bacterium]
MAPRSRAVRSAMGLHLVVPGADVIVDAVFRYDVSDPYAIHVTFRTGPGEDGKIEWLFARQLLGAGLVAPIGDGDVRIWPGTDGEEGPIFLELCSPSGQALFEAPREKLVDFLFRSYALVAPGHEGDFLDIDAELELLLLHGDLA